MSPTPNFVTFPILAAVCVAAGGVYTYLSSAHAQGGHQRHDAQAVQVEQHTEALLKTHVQAEAEQNRLRNDALLRLEAKYDWSMQKQGVGLPPNVPALKDVPLSERPGAATDPTLELLESPDAGHLYEKAKPIIGPGGVVIKDGE